MKLHYKSSVTGAAVLMTCFMLPLHATHSDILNDRIVYSGSVVASHIGEAANSLVLAAATPEVELDCRAFNKARGRVGERVEVGKVRIKAKALPAGVTIVPSRKIEGIYTTDVQTLPEGDSETQITIYYNAQKIGKDEGFLYLMAGEDVLEQISVKGLAIDPSIPPAVKVDPQVLTDFATEVGTPVTQTIQATLVGLPSSVNVSLSQSKPGFSCSTGLLYYSVANHKLVITFNPKQAGDYEATLVLKNEFFEPVELILKGTATAKNDIKPEIEGDRLPLPSANPLPLLVEEFNGVTHNKPLSLEGWSNLATLGSRAWWGYKFPDYDSENAGELVAKVTAYDSKIDLGKEEPCQMLLVTPPLNYNTAESKLFTFRVMGMGMTKEMTDRLLLCSVYMENGQLMAMPVEEVLMPAIPDQNGEWIDFHVDLTGQNLGDMFYMGFLFDGIRGVKSSTTYFIDDVSFGRTDLPLMSLGTREVTMDISAESDRMSPEIKVDTRNLKEPVKLSLGGRDKADFELSSKTLPVEGGTFKVRFKGKGEGRHEAYVKLASRGAATQYVAFFATVATGLQMVEAEATDLIEIFDESGRLWRTAEGATMSAALQGLPQGVYLLRIKGTSGTRSVKLIK